MGNEVLRYFICAIKYIISICYIIFFNFLRLKIDSVSVNEPHGLEIWLHIAFADARIHMKSLGVKPLYGPPNTVSDKPERPLERLFDVYQQGRPAPENGPGSKKNFFHTFPGPASSGEFRWRHADKRGWAIRVCLATLVVIAMCGPVKIAYSAREVQRNSILRIENPTQASEAPVNTLSGQERPPHVPPHVPPDALTALREDIFIRLDSGQDENLPIAEMPYDIPGKEDTVWKRRARLIGMHLRALHGPEAAYQSAFFDLEEQRGSRHTLATVMPLTEIWEGAVFEHLSSFSLKNGNHSAGQESMSLRVGMNPGRTFRPWFALTPYFNFGEANGQGLGIAAGMAKTWRNGASLSGEVFAWRPWEEGYYTIVEDGRKHGVDLAFTLPFTRNLLLSSRAYYEGLKLGEDAKSGAQDAGDRYGIQTRVYYRLLHRDGAFMGYGFRDDNLWNEYLVGCELGMFIQTDFQRYFKPDGFHALNPVPKVFTQEMGISLRYAFSPHLGLTVEGVLGRDSDRDLHFGELAGVNGRLTLVANPHLRIGAGASHRKTSTTLESSGGRETIVSLDVHYTF